MRNGIDKQDRLRFPASAQGRYPLPRLFALYNEYKRYPEEGRKMPSAYREACSGRGLASNCIECRMCESNCPHS